MMKCIDLFEQFGNRYRVEQEPAGEIVRRRGRAVDPWLLVIPCKHGHIYPHGGRFLGASTNHRGPVADRLEKLPCVRVVQNGEDGINVVFDIDDFDQVAAIMRPRRRRRLSPEQLAERSERLRKYQFSPASNDARKRRRCDPGGSIDSQAV